MATKPDILSGDHFYSFINHFSIIESLEDTLNLRKLVSFWSSYFKQLVRSILMKSSISHTVVSSDD